jgi:hypothetical protein
VSGEAATPRTALVGNNPVQDGPSESVFGDVAARAGTGCRADTLCQLAVCAESSTKAA